MIRLVIRPGVTLLVCASLPLTAGCTSYGAHLSATPTPRGQREIAVHTDAVVSNSGAGAQVRPNPELGYRWGLTDDIDVGVRGHGMGAEVNSRFRVTSGYGLDLTASPFVGGGLVPDHEANGGALRFPVGMRALVGWHAPAGIDLTIGAAGMLEPQVSLGPGLGALGAHQQQDSHSRLLISPGALINAQFPLSETLYINFEVNAHLPYDLQLGTWQAPILQGGVAFKWLTF